MLSSRNLYSLPERAEGLSSGTFLFSSGACGGLVTSSISPSSGVSRSSRALVRNMAKRLLTVCANLDTTRGQLEEQDEQAENFECLNRLVADLYSEQGIEPLTPREVRRIVENEAIIFDEPTTTTE